MRDSQGLKPTTGVSQWTGSGNLNFGAQCASPLARGALGARKRRR
jgi:hypothetical protein